jgi:hypothetical protein
VSDGARAIWLPRVEAVRSALETLEIRSIAAGLRVAAVLMCSADELVNLCDRAATLGLVTQPFDRRQLPTAGVPLERFPYRPDRPFAFAVAIARRETLASMTDALQDPIHRAQLVGAPACCAEFLAETYRDGWLDPTWPMARRSCAPQDRVADLQLAAGANTLLRPLGIYPVFHAPCSFACVETLARSAEIAALGRSIGLGQDMEWLDEILSWPTLWSALHGLAEVKNPVLRLVTTTDATGEKIEIRARSERYPLEGARAVRFPYAVAGRPPTSPVLQVTR